MDERDLPPFGGSGIHIVEVGEIERILGFAQYGKCIAFFDGLSLSAKTYNGEK